MVTEIGGKIALVVGGILIGASSSYFVTKKILSKKFDAELDREVEILKDHFGKARQEMESNVEEQVYDRINKAIIKDMGYSQEEETPEEPARHIPEEVQETLPTWGKVVDEADIEWPPAPSEDEDDVVITEVRDLTPTNSNEDEIFKDRDESKPFVITYDEWWDETVYAREELSYFTHCGTVIDEHEEVIPDNLVEPLIGDDFSNYFGIASNDEYVVHVRNHEKKTDYTITREEMSYVTFLAGEEAMAMMEEERHSAPRKMKADE